MRLTSSDAEDVVQETFLGLYRHLLADRPRTNLPGWIFRVAHRLALKRRIRYRADGYEPVDRDLLLIASEEPSPEEEFLLNEQQGRLKRIFHALPEMDRLCLQLRAEGLKYREIAGVLNISLGSVYNSLERSLRRLRS
jgi:RNA polymerase sigma-70 factor (ECF subfamily)